MRTPNSPQFLFLLIVLACLLTGAARPTSADLSEEVRVLLRHLDPVIEGFTAAEPCGLEGINPNVTGRCLSISNGGDDEPLEPCTSGNLTTSESSTGASYRAELPHPSKTENAALCSPTALSLDLWTVSRATGAGGTEALTVVPTARELWTVPTVRTSCGSWQLDMVIDPPPLQTPSALVVERDLPDSEHGSASGILSLGIRSRFTRADGAIVEIPSLIDLDLTGTWSREPAESGSEPFRVELLPAAPSSSCWQSRWIDGQPVLINLCHESLCLDDTPPCSPWCVEPGV